MLVLGTLFSLNWSYATKGCRLVDPAMSSEHIFIVRRRGLVLPIISIFAIALSLIAPAFASYVYLLAPLILVLPPFAVVRHGGECLTSRGDGT
jgi:hypothetical protein